MDAGTAVLVVEDVGGFVGDARCYRLDPPLAGYEFVTVFTSDTYRNEETVVVPSLGPGRRGAALTMDRLPGSVSGFLSHEYALFVAGYALGDPELPAEAEVDHG